MKVRFADDVLVEPSAWRTLTRIVDGFVEERHIWDIDDPAAMADSPWLAGDDPYTRGNLEALKKISTRALYHPAPAHSDTPNRPQSKAHSLSIVVSQTEQAPPGTLAPGDARDALERPAHVVVENGESDKAFLDAMIRAFDRGELHTALEKGWIEVVSAGGGGEIPKRARDLVAKAGKGPRRILILSDSDRMAPGEKTKETIKQILACAEEHEVKATILHKREIENYLPVGALQRVRGKREIYKAFQHLTQEQRDHFDMKKGLKNHPETGKAVIPPAQAALFAKVQPRVIKALCGGFGDKVWRYFDKAADVIDAHSMRSTCLSEPDEIENILDDLERLI